MAEVEIVGSIQRIRFAANDSLFKIATMRVSEVREGNIVKNSFGDVVFKGVVPSRHQSYINDGRFASLYDLQD